MLDSTALIARWHCKVRRHRKVLDSTALCLMAQQTNSQDNRLLQARAKLLSLPPLSLPVPLPLSVSWPFPSPWLRTYLFRAQASNQEEDSWEASEFWEASWDSQPGEAS